MSASLSILTALSPSFPEHGTVLNQRGRINVPKWRRVEEQTRDPEVTWALEALPNAVSRSDILGLRHEDPSLRRRRVAIASLMWGYGIRGARWDRRVGDISNFLSPGLDVVLAECESDLTSGAIAEAYKLFTRPATGNMEPEAYHGIGSSFFTKILYFLARNALQGSMAHYPLMLNTNVSRALAQMTGYRLLVRPEGYRPHPDSGAQAHYVKTMHAWADKLSVLPEVIEYYLWTEAGKSPLWAECAAQHAQAFP